MQAAAAAGLAPKIHYLNIEDKIAITDFIEEKSFTTNEAREKMTDVLRQLYSLPQFSNRLNYVDSADNFLQKFRSSGIVSDTITKSLFELYGPTAAVYPRNDAENLISSHNDVKRDNIIFDGTKPWLVDWEAARLNDRYPDLAALANFVVKNEKDEIDFLERYFEGAVDQYKRARFFLMSIIVHMFCFTLCTMSAAEGKAINIKIKYPGFNEFHDSLWNGEINLANKHEKLQYGLVHMEELNAKCNLCVIRNLCAS